ncbi:MAG: putative Ig domain-containing protein, partial [Pseudomonadota bacterium]
MTKWILTLLGTVFGVCQGAAAGNVFFELDALGGDRWEYHYTLENTTGDAIGGLSVYFDTGPFANLSITGNPNAGTFDEWDGLFIEFDPELPDVGFADWSTLDDLLFPGDSLTGFSVAFDFLGTGQPGSQFFETYRLESGDSDFLDFILISDGFTRPLPGDPPVGVPIPSTLLLFAPGLLLLSGRRLAAGLKRARHRFWRGWLAAAFGLVLLPALPIDQAHATVEAITPEQRDLVNRERRGRFHFDYTYTQTFSYQGDPLTGVIATVTSISPNTVIVDGQVNIGDLPSGQATPLDTFTIRQNRRFPFNPNDLVWTFEADDPPPVGDNAPIIVSSPPESTVVNADYRYNVIAEDADAGDRLSYRLALAPPGMSIDPETGEIAWQPATSATVDVDVRVEDTTGLEDRQIYLLRVASADGDQPPSLQPIPDQVLATGESFEWLATGTDPEGEPLNYRVSQGPAGLAIDPVSGRLLFTANRALLGTNRAVITVSDPGGLVDSTSFSIEVIDNEGNTPPVIANVADIESSVGQTIMVMFSASDADAGDILSFALEGLPAGAQFDEAARKLSWTPTATDVGITLLTLRVIDSAGASAATTFNVNVTSPPLPPVAMDDEYTVGIRERLDVVAPGVLLNDSDGNGDALMAQQLSAPLLGSLEAFEDDGGFSYLPPEIPPIDIGLVEKCSTVSSFSSGTVSAADVDQDGVVELVSLIGGGTNGLFTAVIVIDGRDCSTESVAVVPEFIGAASTSNADTLVNLDDDPELEVVGKYFRFNDGIDGGQGADERLYAVNLDGTPLENWPSIGVSEATSFADLLPSGRLQSSPVAVDLNQDGDPELITGLTNVRGGTTVANTFRNAVVAYDGRTGTIIWEYVGGITRDSDRGAVPTLVDLDIDGDIE